MRLTVLLLMVLTVAVAKRGPVPDVSGVWVAVLAGSDFGVSHSPNRVILNVTRDGTRLNVIEVASGEVGAYVAERQYFFRKTLQPVGKKGSAQEFG